MQRYFIELAYKGTCFCGWQLQPNGNTVQGELERVMTLLLREPVRLTGAGRTDSGVHASFFAAHFDASNEELHKDVAFLYKLNQLIHKEIAVFRIYPVDAAAHARFDAVSRTYQYLIARAKNPFTVDLAYHLYRPLDVEAMNAAAQILPEYTDFTSFSKLHGNAVTNLCKVTEAYWDENEASGELTFTITANRFLRNMVRAVVGTMLEIGLGKRAPEDIRQVIEAKERNAAGTSAPPQGLCLTDIVYPWKTRP
ncbi:tRNA pseudouridine synthase A [Bacteroidia bacterium]|nr:tRNA pseudouridine synthase A [Bacteroidia bacterium]